MALLLLLLSLFAFTAATDPLYYSCGPRENFTGNSNYTFTSMIDDLFTNLYSNTPATGFANYSTAAGDVIIPNLYGFALCRGDLIPETCSSCITQAIYDIQILCPNSNNVSMWYDYCQLSYFNAYNLLVPNVKDNIKLLMTSNMSVSAEQFVRFAVQSNALMSNISDLAVKNRSEYFATGEIALTGKDMLYGMVQCSKDLSVGDCRACLQGAVEAINIDQLKWEMVGRTIGTWCSTRYDLHKFYYGTSMFQLSPNKAQPIRNGSVPKTILPQSVNLSHGGKKSTIRRRVAIFISLGILLLTSTIAYFIWMMKKRDKGTSKLQMGQTLSIQGIDIASKLKMRENNLEFLFISLSSILEATDNFSTANKLGRGGFGSVYKGQQQEGESIAVKRLDAVSSQGLEEFMNEIKLIVKLQHRNLVKLLGCCVEGDEKLLVYEYMPNNSLEYHLFDPIRKEQLDWSKRFSIIEGIAQGLLYLHKYSRVQIIHRDLKASNILLDLDMNPKISDFGIARIFDANTAQANTNRIVGT